MSATRYKRPHVEIFICIEMARERNQGTKKKQKKTKKKKTPGIYELHVTLNLNLILGLISVNWLPNLTKQ